MPFSQKLGGNSKKAEFDINDSLGKNCLSSKQTDYIYKKVELGNLINRNTMREKIDPDIELDRMDDNSGNENPYRELIVNNTGKIENMLSQMEQWSILSNEINCMQYSKSTKNFHAISIKPITKTKVSIGRKEKDKNEFSLQANLMSTLGKSMKEYLDRV